MAEIDDPRAPQDTREAAQRQASAKENPTVLDAIEALQERLAQVQAGREALQQRREYGLEY